MTLDQHFRFLNFDKTTWKMFAVCGLVTCTFGLLARVPAYEDRVLGIVSSLAFDGIILIIAIPYVWACWFPFRICQVLNGH